MGGFKLWWLAGIPLLPAVLVVGVIVAAAELGEWVYFKLKYRDQP